MRITSIMKHLNRAARVNTVLLKKVSIHLLLGLMVLASFSSPASAQPNPDLTPPAYIGSTSNNGNNVYLNFNEAISINNTDALTDSTVTDAVYLKKNMSIAIDGVNFVPLSELIVVSPPGTGPAGQTQIYLVAQNEVKVILGTKTLIKIAGGTLKDAAGNLNDVLTLHVSPPVIQTAVISSDYHEVTIGFHEDVIDNTNSGGISNLKNYIRLLKDGANTNTETELTTDDKVSIVSGKLVIDFATALSGATNQIKIIGGALKDTDGNVLNDNAVTPMLQGGAITEDTMALKLLSSYLTNSYQDLTLVFNKDVLNARSDAASFIAGIQYIGNVTYWQWRSISSDATVTFSGKTATIHFAAPLITGYQYMFQFNANSFKDASGNILKNNVNAGYFYPGQALIFENGSISYDGRWLRMGMNWQVGGLVDRTIVNGVSHLKDQITIDGSPLDAQDVVTIQGTGIGIFFHDAKKSGTVRVKVAANALSDLGDNARNAAIDQVIAYNTPSITGYFLSDIASEFLFNDNAEWRSNVRDIIISNSGAARPLQSSEYILAAGRLTINKGVFQEGGNYQILINADGYSTKYFSGRASKSSELFYMTAPAVTTDNGITAKVNILNNVGTNSTTGTQSVVFELMNGTTPVSIVASNLQVNTGMYSANFNVTDAATNPNYTVRAFVVNKFNNDPTNVGLNLATEVTRTEYDLKLIDYINDND